MATAAAPFALAAQARRVYVETMLLAVPVAVQSVLHGASRLASEKADPQTTHKRQNASVDLRHPAPRWQQLLAEALSGLPQALAAIIANLHDVVIILGFFAFFQWEFSLAVLAAVLAVLGYSVNESVVIFDRIREAFRKYRKMTTTEVIDHAITSTMSRTIITHGCTQLMVLSMLFFGGPTLHYFAVALTIGILFGIYSSVFVAAAIAMWLGVKREDLVKQGGNKPADPNDPNAGAVV